MKEIVNLKPLGLAHGPYLYADYLMWKGQPDLCIVCHFPKLFSSLWRFRWRRFLWRIEVCRVRG
jgi:hypothetical protein